MPKSTFLKNLSRRSRSPQPTKIERAGPPPRPDLAAAPQDLKDKVGAVEGTSRVLQLLRGGSYPGSQASNVASAIAFMEALFTGVRNEFFAHPEFETYFPDLVPAKAAEESKESKPS